jgi:hypothetical protein
MRLDRVTVTGADDSIDPEDLLDLSAKYPWLEWGILLSKRQEGAPRFPSLDWIERLAAIEVDGRSPFKLSGHLCGSWVRDLCKGKRTFEEERASIASAFRRVQLNFHGERHEIWLEPFVEALRSWLREEYIFQFDAVNDALMINVARGGVRCAPLFDTSGGAGIEPETWPSAERFIYSGYAGGLHPDKIVEQIERIAVAAGDARIWIDIETHVRAHDDRVFDMGKVEKFVTAVAPLVGA